MGGVYQTFSSLGQHRHAGPKWLEAKVLLMSTALPARVGPPSPSALDGLQLPGSLPRTIVAFVGENENGILRRVTAEMMEIVRPHGLVGHVIDFSDPAWADELRGLLEAGVLFAWSAAGVGARLNPGGQLLWDAVSVPFVSVLSDSPSWMPANHHVPSQYVANGYVFEDWLKMQRRLIRSPQISSLLPLGTDPNPLRDVLRWSERPRRMLFVKTGHAPSLHRSRWLGLPPRFRAVLEDTAAAVLQQGVGDITDTMLACLDHHNLYLEQRPDVLFGLMREVDVYVRDARSTAMVHALLDLPVDIIGRGWDHVERLGGKARFHKAVDAATLPKLYSETQFLVNTMPNFSTRTHERVLHGFAAKSCVVTNENQDMRQRFGKLPSYFAVDTEHDDLASRMAELFHGTTCYDDLVQPALDLVAADFSAAGFMRGLIDLAMEVRAAGAYSGYKY